MKQLPREQWVSVLSALPRERLKSAVEDITDGWSIHPKTIPQSGLGMLKMLDSALNEPYYLGEFPLSSCWLTVTTDMGETAEGAALVMDDDREYGEIIAICDAVLSAKLPGWETVEALMLEGLNRRDRIAIERKAMLARTRVDFALLDDVGEEDA